MNIEQAQRCDMVIKALDYIECLWDGGSIRVKNQMWLTIVERTVNYQGSVHAR
jgi:hypothetical protein